MSTCDIRRIARAASLLLVCSLSFRLALVAAQGPSDGELAADAAEALLRGCDMLDPAHCMYPFPSDHFTKADATSPTGRRVAFNVAGMPRNVSARPIDPTEWNRNDGFSVGQMIVTFVPGIAFDPATGAITGAAPITNIPESLDPGTSIFVLNTATGERHPLWAEIDANADLLVRLRVDESPVPKIDEPPINRPVPGRAAVLIRPARSLEPGVRYVVVLRNLKDANGNTIPANAAFAVCRDKVETTLPPLQERCGELEANVFPVLETAGVPRDGSLFLAWDFTVASDADTTARLGHMIENALGSLAGGAPKFTVDTVTENPDTGIARRIEGTFTIPSYVVPMNPTPFEAPEIQSFWRQYRAQLPQQLSQLFGAVDTVGSVRLPPNRLFYDPTDGPNPVFGDGLPDRVGGNAELSARYTCNVPRAALGGKDFSTATAADLEPARASLYGHGLLGTRSEVNAEHVRTMGGSFDVMYCATEWFGFSLGDLPNVATITVDVSNFPVLPDASQQGMVNQSFLARLLVHEGGFAANEAFRVDGIPVFDRRHVFYDGNSQGGILGGVVVAVSPDVDRGVLGVPGMNFSTLLRRSADFDLFAIPMYLSYQDELDRNFIFSMMQMLWDRSENDGYARHLNVLTGSGRTSLDGGENQVLLHPALGDHQVSMWAAEVMARTIGASVDRSRIDPARHPDTAEYFAIPLLKDWQQIGSYPDFDGSAIVVWDEPWTSTTSERCTPGGVSQTTPPPPTTDTPPRQGADPHECPRREVSAQCQKSHFLHPQGAVIDASGVTSVPTCPSLPPVSE